MAEKNVKVLNTRIKLRYDSLTNWQNSAEILLAGEIAIATAGESASPLIKVGDGKSTWSGLGYLYANAADVAAWAKAADKPNYNATEVVMSESDSTTVFAAIKAIQDTMAHTSDLTNYATKQALQDAVAALEATIALKADKTALEALEKKVVALEGVMATKADKSDLDNYVTVTVFNEHETDNNNKINAINDAKTGILAQAKEYADGLAGNYDAAGAASDVKTEVIGTATDAKEADTIYGAKAFATHAVSAERNSIDQELAKKADKEQVATDIAKAVEDSEKEIAKEIQAINDVLGLTDASGESISGQIDVIKGDISDLEGKDTELEGLINGLDSNKASKKELEDAVKELEDADSALDGRLVKVETFFKTAEGETINEAMDTLVEIQKYITEDGKAADEMIKDIAANAKTIGENSAAIDGLKTRMDTAEGEIDALQQAVDAIDVAGNIATALQPYETKAQAEAKYETKTNVDAFKQAQEKAHNDLEAELAKKAVAETVNAAIEGLDGRIDALEAIDHTHKNFDLLETYTQTEADLADAVAKKHAHANATVLDGITATQVGEWDTAYDKAHSHTFVEAELNKIKDGDVAKWNGAQAAAEATAKAYTDTEVKKVADNVQTLSNAVNEHTAKEHVFVEDYLIIDCVTSAAAGFVEPVKK